MKNLLILLAIFLGSGLASAQENKPTKEETIKYITNLLDKKDVFYIVFPESGKSGVLNPKSRQKTFVDSISVDKCNLSITLKMKNNESYNDIKWYKYSRVIDSHQVVGIPLNKIELIKSGHITYPDYENLSSNYILFRAVQNSKIIFTGERSISEYIESGKIEQGKGKNEDVSEYIFYINTIDIEKLTKAFNHLRKLCGAPEPISFD